MKPRERCVYVDRILVLAVCILLAPGVVYAQTASGQVTGTVTDPANAAVPGAAVTLHNLATNIDARATTNTSGLFAFIGVQPGRYTLRIESTGFKAAQVPPFVVDVNQTVVEDAALSLGQVSESVEVKAGAEMVQTSSAELGTVIPENAVNDLPLNGRNFTQLLTLTPGVSPIGTGQAAVLGLDDGSTVGIPGSSFVLPSLQGQFNRSILFYLDGIINTDLRTTTYTVLPNIDLIQEFKVQSHNNKVEFGGVTGGIVNVVSKSGTNQFHGSAYEFVRNNFFDARDPFGDLYSSGPAPYHQNQFGASTSGPVIKNRTFFSGGYEGWRYSKPSQIFSRVPTAAELNGDFSHSIIGQNIYNPFSTRTDASGNLIRDPFPNNIIPTSLISPMMQGFMKAYAEVPNYSNDPYYNFELSEPLTNDSNSWQVKIDHRLRQSDSLFFRWSQMRTAADTPSGLKSASVLNMVANNIGGGWLHLFSPTVVLDVRGGYAARDFDSYATSTVGLGPMKQLGFADVDRFDGLAISLLAPWNGAALGGGTVGAELYPYLPRNPVWNLSSNLSWLKGKNNFKMGFEFIHVGRKEPGAGQTYNFQNDPTEDPQNIGTTGASLASALLALPSSFSGSVPGPAPIVISLAQYSGYFQDEWKLTPNVTVNYGLRFDHTTRPTFGNHDFTAGPDLATGDWLIGLNAMPPPCNQSPKPPCIPGNGLQDVPFSQYIKLASPGFVPTPEWDNWGPRASVAWRISRKMVFRAGYGLFFDGLPSLTQMAENSAAVLWPDASGFYGTANAIGQPNTLLQNIQGTFPVVLPGASPWNESGWFNNPTRKDAYSHQWNMEVQQQMTDSLMLSVGYVGSVNRRLEYSGLGNQAPPGPGSPDEVNARRPMPYMWGGFFYSDGIGKSSYNSLQVKLDRRFAHGLQMLISYTWSKSIDTGSSGWFDAENGPGGDSAVQNYNTPNANRSVSSFNIPQFVSLYTLYELPIGRGKPWLNSGLASYIFGNWQLNNVFQARSGQPFNLGVNGDVANTGNDVGWFNYERPNLVGNPIPAQQTSEEWFNPAAFSVPQYTYGNFGRNVLYSQRVIDMDLSIFKSFPIKETQRIELRFEGFNIFNIINYAPPAITINQGDAGRVTAVAVPPREIQLGVKYIF